MQNVPWDEPGTPFTLPCTSGQNEASNEDTTNPLNRLNEGILKSVISEGQPGRLSQSSPNICGGSLWGEDIISPNRNLHSSYDLKSTLLRDKGLQATQTLKTAHINSYLAAKPNNRGFIDSLGSDA